MKTRLLLSGMLLLGLAMTTSAQEKPAVKPEAKEGEKAKLTLAGDMRNIPIEELIKWWCEYEKVNVMYQPAQIASFKVSLLSPSNGTDIPTDKFGQLVSDAIEQFKLVIVEISENRYSIIQGTEACTQAPIVDAEAARKTPGWRWVTARLPLRYSDPNAVRAALQNLMSRQGGSVNPIMQPQFLLVCDRADRLRRIIDAVEAFEAEGARRTAKTYEFPEGIDAPQFQAAFGLLVGERGAVERYSGNGSAAALNRIVVRGQPEQIALCDELHKQICANASKLAEQTKMVSRRYEVAQSPEQFVESLGKLFKDKLTAAVVPGASAIIVKATTDTHDDVKAALELMK